MEIVLEIEIVNGGRRKGIKNVRRRVDHVHIAEFYYGKGKFHLWDVPPGMYRLHLEPLDSKE